MQATACIWRPHFPSWQTADRDSGWQLCGSTVTQVKKPGRVKGRGELYVRFDTLTLPNGVCRDFVPDGR